MNKLYTEKDIENLLKLMTMLDVKSLNYVIESDDENRCVSESGDFIKDNSPGPQELLEEKELKELLQHYISKLQPKEECIIRARFGFDDGNYKTLEEVGEIFNVTRERIRQIEAKALKRLKWLITVKGKHRNINEF